MKRWALALGAVVVLAITLLMWRAGQSPQAAVLPSTHAETRAAAPNVGIEGSQPTANVAAASEVSDPSAAAPATSPSAHAEPAPAEILVRGIVRDERGESVIAFGLTWIDEYGAQRLARGTGGSYSIAGVRPGAYQVVERAPESRRETIDVLVDSTPAIQERDFVVHSAAKVIIKVVDRTGRALAGDSPGVPADTSRAARNLAVRATRYAPAALVSYLSPQSIQPSDCGIFHDRGSCMSGRSLAPEVFGVLELSESPPIHVSLSFGTALVATREILEVPEELVFVLDPGCTAMRLASVRARVVGDPDGSAIPHAHADLFCSEFRVRHEADAEGRLEIRDLLPASYTLLLPRGEESRLPIEFEVAAGQDLDLGDISAHEDEQLRLRLEYPGDVLPEVTFRMRKLDASRPLGTLDMAPGMPRGSLGGNPAQIPFPGPGRFELHVTRTEDPKTHEAMHLCALPTRFTLGPTPGPEVVVRLLAGTRVCLRPSRNSIGRSRWLISNSEGLPCLLPEIEGRSPLTVELPSGDYRIARVDPTTGIPGKAQTFRVGSEFVTVELQP